MRTMRERSAVRLSGTLTVRPVAGERRQNGLADPPDGVGDELDALVRIELPRGGEQADIALADQVGEGQPAVLVLLGHRDDEAQVAFHQLLHRLVIAGAHLPRDRDFLLRGEERGLADLVQILVEDVLVGIVDAETGGAVVLSRRRGLAAGDVARISAMVRSAESASGEVSAGRWRVGGRVVLVVLLLAHAVEDIPCRGAMMRNWPRPFGLTLLAAAATFPCCRGAGRGSRN